MSLLTEQKEQLISCINEKLLDRRQLLDIIQDYFKDLKLDESKEWKIDFTIGEYDKIEIDKKIYSDSSKKPWYLTEKQFLENNKFRIWVRFTNSKSYKFHNYKEVDLGTLREFVKNMDNILVLMAAQDGCTLDGLGPVAVPTSKEDRMQKNVDNFLKEKEKEKQK